LRFAGAIPQRAAVGAFEAEVPVADPLHAEPGMAGDRGRSRDAAGAGRFHRGN
jgi:hypothetical protein